MVWLLSGMLVVVGLVVLVAVILPVVSGLRRGQLVMANLRACVGDGSERLRAGGETVREWREARSHTGLSDSSA